MRVKMKKDKTAAGETGIYREGQFIDCSDEEGAALVIGDYAEQVGPPSLDPAPVEAPAVSPEQAAQDARVAEILEEKRQLEQKYADEVAARKAAEGKLAATESRSAPTTEIEIETATTAGSDTAVTSAPVESATVAPTESAVIAANRTRGRRNTTSAK